MDTTDEIPVEDHRYFRARLEHLATRHRAMLLALLESGTLTEHLRQMVMKTILAKGDLVVNRQVPDDVAEELVMKQFVADPFEHSRLENPESRIKLQLLLTAYRAILPHLPRTYLSQNEITG